MRYGIDPMTEDTAERERRADEAEREQRWAAFLNRMRDGRIPTHLRHVADLLEDRRDPCYVRINEDIVNFVETEGYSGVLAVLAKVQREQEDERLNP